MISSVPNVAVPEDAIPRIRYASFKGKSAGRTLLEPLAYTKTGGLRWQNQKETTEIFRRVQEKLETTGEQLDSKISKRFYNVKRRITFRGAEYVLLSGSNITDDNKIMLFLLQLVSGGRPGQNNLNGLTFTSPDDGRHWQFAGDQTDYDEPEQLEMLEDYIFHLAK